MNAPPSDKTYLIDKMKLMAVYVVRHASGIMCVMDTEDEATRYIGSNPGLGLIVEPWVVCRLIEGKPVPITRD